MTLQSRDFKNGSSSVRPRLHPVFELRAQFRVEVGLRVANAFLVLLLAAHGLEFIERLHPTHDACTECTYAHMLVCSKVEKFIKVNFAREKTT